MRNGKVREESVKIGSTYLEQEALERNLENEDYQKKKKKLEMVSRESTLCKLLAS